MARTVIDLNCDMGELADPATDRAIMPFVTSANIACGFHAGTAATMRRTVELALQYQVAIGAHPSLLDREGFGRRELATTPEEAYEIVLYQTGALAALAKALGAKLHHVKPHGALYNMAVRSQPLAHAIARAVRDFDPALLLYGLSGSHLISEAAGVGLRTASEVFADRSYQPDGSLTPRQQAGAMIEDPAQSVAQVLQMVRTGRVTAVTGETIRIAAETICLHGDQPQAADFARTIRSALRSGGLAVEPVSG